jgi:hypothetical protein
MFYEFPPDVEKLIHQQMATGLYRTQDDVLRDALLALGAQNEAVVPEDPIVVEGIRRGLADMKAGRGGTLAEFDAEFRAKHNIPKDA